VHNLPSGGAVRVLVEWLTHTRAEVTVYARDRDSGDFAQLPSGVRAEYRPLSGREGVIGEAVRLLRSPRDGRRLAREIDAGGYDAVFCFASRLTQAPDVLPYLRTPSLYYAPEPLRSVYEPCEQGPPRRGARERLVGLALGALDRRRRALDRRYIRSAGAIVTHSQFTRRTLSEIYGVQAEVVLLGVDAATFVPAQAGREGYVLSVGALHPLKGHEQVIEALATLPDDTGLPARPRLVVIGDRGEGAPALQALARRRGVELELHNRLAFEQVVAAYQRAGVVACAQVREPFGLVALEAMACATPVVAVAEGGFQETVTDGETGLLCARDPRLLGSAIARVLSDPALARRLGATARERVRRDWTWERAAGDFDALLARVARR